jgi:glutaredoxin 3
MKKCSILKVLADKLYAIMLTLYYKPTCRFCRKVLATIETLSISVTLKDVSASEVFKEELIAHGGKRQVPYLVDDVRGTALYESDEIIAYLKQQYRGDTPDSNGCKCVKR